MKYFYCKDGQAYAFEPQRTKKSGDLLICYRLHFSTGKISQQKMAAIEVDDTRYSNVKQTLKNFFSKAPGKGRAIIFNLQLGPYTYNLLTRNQKFQLLVKSYCFNNSNGTNTKNHKVQQKVRRNYRSGKSSRRIEL